QVGGHRINDDAAGVLTGALSRALGEAVGPYPIIQGTLAANSNYRIDFTGSELAVTAATLTVVADRQSKVYGELDSPLSYLASGFKRNDPPTVLTGALARTPGEAVAGSPYAINQGTLAANTNYAINFTGHDLEITPAPLAVEADHETKEY